MRVGIAYAGMILLSSTVPLAIKLSVIDGDILFPLIVRIFIGFMLAMGCLLLVKEKLSFDRQAMSVYFSSALGLVGAALLAYWSAQFIDSGLMAILLGLAPIVVGILAMPILKDPFFSLRQLLGIGFAVLGLIVIFYHGLSIDDESWKGIAGGIMTVLLLALSAVLVKRLGNSMSAFSTNAGSLLASVFLFIPIFFFSGHHVPEKLSSTVIYATVYLGVFASFFTYMLYYYVLKHMSATSVMLANLITPVIALVLGHLLNDEIISSNIVVGAILVLTGLLAYQLPSFGIKTYFQK